jgi:hypothetical protein
MASILRMFCKLADDMVLDSRRPTKHCFVFYAGSTR